ncbi:MAG: glycerol-3-phosphate 1-O-acyltransferase PlsY [Planctomycetes bacterium]|nr:glycerol-3-phosphate 1-O-acyltransferase PlsY [Planctomycetota bacterium]
MIYVWIVGTLLVSYLVGGVPFGLLAGKLIKGVDIRQHGSRNIGATNAARVIGWKWFPVVLLLDALKGAGPCLAGLWLSGRAGTDLALFAAIGALAGHLYSVYLKFKGGKGVATGLGVVLVLTVVPDIHAPLPALCALGVFGLVLLATRMVSVSSIVAALSVPVFYYAWLGGTTFTDPYNNRFIFLVLVSLFVVVKHRANIRRIMSGTEPRIGRKKPEVTNG